MNADNPETPLIQKLGFGRGESVFVEDTPDWYSDFAATNEFELEPGLPATHAHIFCDTKETLVDFLTNNDTREIENSLWLSWPKKASGVKTDITEQDLRDALLPLGWVDVKVAVIDDTWSGLKFLRRKA